MLWGDVAGELDRGGKHRASSTKPLTGSMSGMASNGSTKYAIAAIRVILT